MTDERILYLFNRVYEPIYIPKTEDKIVFAVPPSYVEERFQPQAKELLDESDANIKYHVKKVNNLSLDLPMQLDRHKLFSSFIPAHREMAECLLNTFLEQPTYDDLLSVATYCRDIVNPHLFVYALCVAMLHREDTQHLPLPSVVEVFPDKFIDSKSLVRARRDSYILPAASPKPTIVVHHTTGTNLDIENRLAYFREDIGVNLHHWHWHLTYPYHGDKKIQNKDRRGELFYYMHHQIMARYNVERLCNKLNRVTRLIDLRQPIPEAYFPKLDSINASRVWPSRPSHMTLRNVSQPKMNVQFDIQDLERWRDRILEAISTGKVINSNNEVQILDEKTGIDILGNIVEATGLSINKNHYGDIHNLGHLAIAFCHDPDSCFEEEFSIMGDSTTAMRDPVFYRWHAFLDSLFKQYKETLPPYESSELALLGVTITDVTVTDEFSTESSLDNSINTFWNQSDVDIANGLDFTSKGSIITKFTHLNHDTFVYKIGINSTADQKGTCRIFIAPKYNERREPFRFIEQKDLMIELDKFTVNLKQGQNEIVRSSTESTVTVPIGQTFRSLKTKSPKKDNTEAFYFCGCGWPHYMLTPKGTKSGYPMELFVMISNYDDDKITGQETIGIGASYCGVRKGKYPDARAMGYPFDRPPRKDIREISEFLTSNMKVIQMTVKFTDEIRPHPKTTDKKITMSM